LPFGEYKDMEDCISKNQDKDNPGAYCASIHHQITGKWPSQKEAYRHSDFEKIRDQFLTHIKDEAEAVNRYNSWIQALNLDETKPYGDSRKEQFSWIKKHVNFGLWKEDNRAKYWQVEAGFPVESMNYNVYTEQELQESARTIKGKSVNLNHKYSLPTVEIVAGQYEGGVVECVLRVPRELHCPICDKTKTVNDLIESSGIVNVSLEASCTLKSDEPGKCEGMEFTGLSLLTKDTLPGIPLTRMMPLESIMVEALQSSTKKETRKVKKVKLKIVEQAQPRTDAERAKAHFNLSDEEWDKLTDEEKQAYIDKLPERGSAEILEQQPTAEPPKPKGVLPDEHGQCPQGTILNSETGLCVKDTSCPPGKHWDDSVQGCVEDAPEDSVKPEIEVGKSPAPLVMPKLEQEEPSKCPDGYHYDVSAQKCVPDEPTEKLDSNLKFATEKVSRIKAESKAKSLEEQAATLEKDNLQLEKQVNILTGKATALEKTIDKLEKQVDSYNVKKVEDEVKLKDMHRRIEDLTVSRDDYKQQLEKLRVQHEEQTAKYHTTLATNLELSRKLTKSNEDYLGVAKERDDVNEQLKKAKVLGKKIIRIKAA